MNLQHRESGLRLLPFLWLWIRRFSLRCLLSGGFRLCQRSLMWSHAGWYTLPVRLWWFLRYRSRWLCPLPEAGSAEKISLRSAYPGSRSGYLPVWSFRLRLFLTGSVSFLFLLLRSALILPNILSDHSALGRLMPIQCTLYGTVVSLWSAVHFFGLSLLIVLQSSLMSTHFWTVSRP